MSAFQYQKGFVAEYLLTGNRAWLAELETSRPAFESWLRRPHGKIGDRRLRRSCSTRSRTSTPPTISARKTAIALYDAGQVRRGQGGAADSNHAQCAAAARSVLTSSAGLARADAERTLARDRTHRSPAGRRAGRRPASRAPWPACWSASCGRAGSPSRSTSWRCRSSRRRNGRASRSRRAAPGWRRWATRSSAIVEKLEETDAALAEHRRRLVQSEKLSAVGELAAKLAHEVLNPLAGMKAAMQLLARAGRRPRRAATSGRDGARRSTARSPASRGWCGGW